MTDINELTISGYFAKLASGEITCEALVSAYLGRIEAFDKHGAGLNAVIAVNPRALEAASELDAAYKEHGLTGPLHGVPVLLKDNCETRDMPTTAGSLSLAGFETGKDAEIVARLRRAGAVIVAKTNLHEFAIWGETVSSVLGQTRNPYDLSRTPGGSSGGTGAAVAANFGLAGIGTDTINSIRSPASANALCGIRPTVGLVSDRGIVPYSHTQDTAGPICRTVEDAARVFEVIATSPDINKICLSADALCGKRIGVLRSFCGKDKIHQPVNEIFGAALELMRRGGASLTELDDNIDPAALVSDISVHLHELKFCLGEYLGAFGDAAPARSVGEILASGKFSPSIGDNLRRAEELGADSPEYAARLKLRESLIARVRGIFERHSLDAIVYPHQQQPVCKIGESQKGRNGALASVTGFPAVVTPGGFTKPDMHAPLGVPVGIEFMGLPYSDSGLISLAYGFEQAAQVRKAPIL